MRDRLLSRSAGAGVSAFDAEPLAERRADDDDCCALADFVVVEDDAARAEGKLIARAHRCDFERARRRYYYFLLLFCLHVLKCNGK